MATARLPYDGISPAWAERQLAAFRALSPSPPPDSFSAYVFGRLLESDLRESCLPVLPAAVGSLHGVTIQGTCILQIVDVVNIGANFEHRTEDARGPTRTLKMCFTDGHQLVFGFEFQWLPQFSVQTPRGSKVAMQNVDVRHGMLMLAPQNCQLLSDTADAAAPSQQGVSGDGQDSSKPSGVYAAALTTAQFGSASSLMSVDSNTTASSGGASLGRAQSATASSAAAASAAAASAAAGVRVPATSRDEQPRAMAAAAQVSSGREAPPPPVFVDAASSEDDCESDMTDPMVEHLFYSPNTPREPPTSPRLAGKRPLSDAGAADVVSEGGKSARHKVARPAEPGAAVVDGQDACAAESGTGGGALVRPAPEPAADPSRPFQYFSANPRFSHLSALQPSARPRRVDVRAFVKSVAGFQFQGGEYQLRVLVEDCSQVRQADVAPALVTALMGVPCAGFTRAMQQAPATARRWAAHMQFALMTLEGVMTFRVERGGAGAASADRLTLERVRDVTRGDAGQLLARVAQSMRNGR